MKHLVVGAGATLAEALALGNPREDCPPVMSDFTKKMWGNYTPYPFLWTYLNELGFVDLGHDPRELFHRLEMNGDTNIERFMQYCWENRAVEITKFPSPLPPGFIYGFSIFENRAIQSPALKGEELWYNLLCHGIGSPLQLMMINCFFENGHGWRDFTISKAVISHLKSDDLVLNLNYDTVFELAIRQSGREFCYSPQKQSGEEICVCKPHGSLNMVSNDHGFMFGQPDWLGMPQPSGYRSFSALVPPRLDKRFNQHPISRIIVESVYNRKPQEVIFWGVGLTESDADLIDLYRSWTIESGIITVVNPDRSVAVKIENILVRPVRYFPNVPAWLSGLAQP